jgi:hypothetical protein
MEIIEIGEKMAVAGRYSHFICWVDGIMEGGRLERLKIGLLTYQVSGACAPEEPVRSDELKCSMLAGHFGNMPG